MQSVRKNYLYNVIYEILAIILPLITAPYISRVLQEEALGIHTYTLSIAYYFTLFSLLGIPNYGVRQIARVRENRDKLSVEFISIYLLQLIVASFVLLCYFGYVFFISNDLFSVKMIQSIIVVSFVFDISWFFFGIENFKLTVTRNIIIRITTVILVFTFVKNPNDLWKYSLIMALSNFINAISLWSFLPKYIDFKKVSLDRVFSHFKPAAILLIPNLAVGFYTLMDKVMLGKLSNVAQVAFYYSAEKITNIPMGFIVAFGNVMMPRSAFLVESGSHDLLKENIRKSIKFNILLSSAIAFGISAIAPLFIPLFFGPRFARAGEVAVFLSIIIIFKSWAIVLRKQYLIPYNRDKDFTLSVVLGALVNLIANAILIPKFQALGAVFGTILAEFAVALYQTIAVRNDLDIRRYLRESYIYILIGVAMFAVIKLINIYMPQNLIGVLIEVLVGAVIYLSLVYFFTPDRDEILKMLEILKNKYLRKKA